jgi:FAD/FMN-containing dehydrogenase
MRCCAATLEEPIGTQAVDPSQWLRTCATVFKNQIPGFPDSYPAYISDSNYNLISQPGGLCADHLSCAFEDCSWTAEAKQALLSADLAKVDITTLPLPPLSLPTSISFPQSVRDIVDALARNAAAGTRQRVSIKTSGHSYVGSSSVKDSLLLNLRSFPKYSATSITSCTSPPAQNSSPCKLAIARGKRAMVRVGGGERWGDVYLAVLANNQRAGTTNYTVMGGGAGSVGAAGGWMQGGGLSLGQERMYGFGVDQVLELEMVLADGTHVKFGPTLWEAAPGFLYPRTTKVEGQCNANVVADEAAWQWGPCGRSIPFSDLWFAVRGGGGGSYGIVTSVRYQLHDFKPLHLLSADFAQLGEQCTQVQCDAAGFAVLWYGFPRCV